MLSNISDKPTNLKAYALELVMQPIQNPSTIKDKGWLQHGLIDPLIVQLLQGSTGKTSNFSIHLAEMHSLCLLYISGVAYKIYLNDKI